MSAHPIGRADTGFNPQLEGPILNTRSPLKSTRCWCH